MLAAIAEFERELIRERTGEGRRRAMAAGVQFGRPQEPEAVYALRVPELCLNLGF
jgi:DNA invertase Pin-like site-specific DNA recombinase